MLYEPFPPRVSPRHWFCVAHEVPTLEPSPPSRALSAGVPGSAPGSISREGSWCCSSFSQHPAAEGTTHGACADPPSSQGALPWQGHRPKVDVTTQEDRYARLVSSLRSFVLLADRLRRTAPQAAEMGQALVMGLHTVKKSTEGGNL